MIAGIIVVVLVVAAVFLVRRAMQPQNLKPSPAAVAGNPAAASTAPTIAHPIDQVQSAPAEAGTAPTPALDGSDASVLAGLGGLNGGGALRALLLPTQVIPHIVATVDALPRSGIGSQIVPVHGAKGVLETQDAQGQLQISDANAARYAPYVDALKGLDAQAAVGWYKQQYPLFQHAYQELGYPKGYFNDRLVAVIDHVLAAPVPPQPLMLVRAEHGYAYADPALEGLSVGQKTMIRIGPADEAVVKAKLREIRALLVHAVPPATAASTQPATTSSAN